jgi:hypothetical protein
LQRLFRCIIITSFHASLIVRTLQVLAVRGERDWADVDDADEALPYADGPTLRRLWGLPAAPPSDPQHVRHHVSLGLLICSVVDLARMPGHHSLVSPFLSVSVLEVGLGDVQVPEAAAVDVSSGQDGALGEEHAARQAPISKQSWDYLIRMMQVPAGTRTPDRPRLRTRVSRKMRQRRQALEDVRHFALSNVLFARSSCRIISAWHKLVSPLQDEDDSEEQAGEVAPSTHSPSSAVNDIPLPATKIPEVRPDPFTQR